MYSIYRRYNYCRENLYSFSSSFRFLLFFPYTVPLANPNHVASYEYIRTASSNSIPHHHHSPTHARTHALSLSPSLFSISISLILSSFPYSLWFATAAYGYASIYSITTFKVGICSISLSSIYFSLMLAATYSITRATAWGTLQSWSYYNYVWTSCFKRLLRFVRSISRS